MEKDIIFQNEEDIFKTFLGKFNDILNQNKAKINTILETIRNEDVNIKKLLGFFATYNKQIDKILENEFNLSQKCDKDKYTKKLATVLNNEEKFNLLKEKSEISINKIKSCTENFIEELFLDKNNKYSKKEIIFFKEFCFNLIKNNDSSKEIYEVFLKNNKTIQKINIIITELSSKLNQVKKNEYHREKKFEAYKNNPMFNQGKYDNLCGYTRLCELVHNDDDHIQFFLLLQKIFSGEMEFKVIPLKSDATSEKLSVSYSFKDCYDELIKSFSEKKDFSFDVLSPQYMPRTSNVQKQTRNLEYGTFHYLSADAKFMDDHDQWEVHLNTEKHEAYSLLTLKHLPPAKFFRKVCGDKILQFDTTLLHEIDSRAAVKCSHDIESGLYPLRANVYFNEICTPSPHLDGQVQKTNFPTFITLRSSSNTAKTLNKSIGLNSYKIAFIKERNYIFMMSIAEAHCYDARFSIYFDKLNEIISENFNSYQSYSYFYYLFLLSFGIKISFYENNIKENAGLKDLNVTNIEFFTSNSFLFKKIHVDIINKLFLPKSMLKNYDGIFNFLQNIYISTADLENFKLKYKDINKSFWEAHSHFYENFIFVTKPNPKSPMQIIPNDICIPDIIKYLMEPISCEDAKLCRAALALHFKDDAKEKNEILNLFYPEKYTMEIIEDNGMKADRKRKTTQTIQRDIVELFKKIRKI